MAGYIFSSGKDTDLDNSPLTIGVYSYRLKNSPSGRWLVFSTDKLSCLYYTISCPQIHLESPVPRSNQLALFFPQCLY